MKKDLAFRISELEKSLGALIKANNQYCQEHDDTWLLFIAAQLRGLIASGISRNMHPLLLELSDQLGIPLKLYSRPGKTNPPPMNLVANFVCGKTWSTKVGHELIEFELKNWLITPRYFVDTSKMYTTPNELLRAISERSGGVHYDEYRAPSEESLSRLYRGNDSYRISGVQIFLLDIAALVYWLGMRLVYTYYCKLKGNDPEHDPIIKTLDENMEKIRT